MMVALLVIFTIGTLAWIGHRTKPDPIDTVRTIPDRWLIGAMLAGLGVQAALVIVYGLPALAVLRERSATLISYSRSRGLLADRHPYDWVQAANIQAP